VKAAAGGFVTVTGGPEGSGQLNDSVMATLDAHLTAGEPVVNPGALQASAEAGGDIEKRIQQILETEIRPAVAMDGGDIIFDRFEGGVVYLQMRGSCAGCPSSTMTLKMGIESRLREAIPEVVEVVSV
jgi:Fe-S cluster biogenesis protein NfuA